jgi:hypothetical protein
LKKEEKSHEGEWHEGEERNSCEEMKGGNEKKLS